MLYMSADAATKSINDIEACRPKWRTSVWFPTANERCIASAQREEKELIDACCINVDHHMTQPWIELLGENFGSAYQWWRRGITNIDLVRQLIRHRVPPHLLSTTYEGGSVLALLKAGAIAPAEALIVVRAGALREGLSWLGKVGMYVSPSANAAKESQESQMPYLVPALIRWAQDDFFGPKGAGKAS